MLTEFLVAGWHAHRVARHLADGAFADDIRHDQLWLRPISDAFHGQGKHSLTCAEKIRLLQFVTGTVPTRTRLHIQDYAADPSCPLCPTKLDTAHHRAYECTFSDHAVQQHWRDLLLSRPLDPRARGLFPAPSLLAKGEDDTFLFDASGGALYRDGSALQPQHPELQTAPILHRPAY